MKIYYDYTDLIDDLADDLQDEILFQNSIIKIVRGDRIKAHNQFNDMTAYYKPIIDYYYADDELDEDYKEMTVAEVLKEMLEMNGVI